MPAGYRVEYGGQFESQQSATRRLLVLGIGVVVGLFMLLVLAFVLFGLSGSVSSAAEPWVFVGAIAAFALAFAIPTAIVPALEDR